MFSHRRMTLVFSETRIDVLAQRRTHRTVKKTMTNGQLAAKPSGPVVQLRGETVSSQTAVRAKRTL